MLFAETNMTAGEILLIISGVSTGIVLVVGAIAAGVVTVMNARKQRDDEVVLKNVYAGLANEIMKAAVDNENNHRAEKGKDPIVLPAPVIAEGNSPPKDSQQEAAAIATLRASAAIFKLQTGLPARKEPNDTETKEETDSPGSPSNSPAAAEPKTPEQETVERVGEQIGEAVVKAAEQKIIAEVKATEGAIIDRIDKDKDQP